MNAFEILLDQDPNLKLGEQENVLCSIAVVYSKLDHSDNRIVEAADRMVEKTTPLIDGGDMEVKLELAHLDSCLSHLTNRVEVPAWKLILHVA